MATPLPQLASAASFLDWGWHFYCHLKAALLHDPSVYLSISLVAVSCGSGCLGLWGRKRNYDVVNMELLPLVLDWRSGGTSWMGLSSPLWYRQTIQTSLIFTQLNGWTPAKIQLHPTNLALITLNLTPSNTWLPPKHMNLSPRPFSHFFVSLQQLQWCLQWGISQTSCWLVATFASP